MAEKALIVVESPSKARTIKKYLGADVEVKASVGHVKDLPKSEIGVDIDNGFEPQYETIRGKGKVLQDIRTAAKKADVIYLAPDPDREGEAIAWHIASELNVPPEKIRRVLFHEITASAIRRAMEEPNVLDLNRFNSQQARRILDRLVGYKVSPLLWKKVRRGLSAGRVQSVAVRIVVERNQQIEAFDAEEFWRIEVELEGQEEPIFHARLARIEGEKAVLSNGDQAQAVLDAVGKGPFHVLEVEKKQRKQSPAAPFITSRLQQEAARACHFTAKRTMGLAQRLYEGVELGDEGAVGLITYMRTDSTRLSGEAVGHVREYIADRYGAEYVPETPNVYKTKGRAQDAHEAIRPTSLAYPPERVQPHLQPAEFKLYNLIWKRFVACQMKPALFDMTRVDVGAPGDHVFRASGSIKVFDGYTTAYQATRSEDEDPEQSTDLPPLDKGDELRVLGIEPTQHFTQPPPRFTEATLVRELEDKGIGRPSTYANIISTIQEKLYVEKQSGRFHPSELGVIVNELLVTSFPRLFDVGFTARMEDELDAIEDGRVEWRELLGDFWTRFAETLETAKTEMRDVKREEKPTDLDCPRDGAKLVIKFGKNGSFLACSSYPECNFTSEFDRDREGAIEIRAAERVGETCSACGEGDLIFKSGRFGRFVGCSNYPECKHTQPISTGVKCPACDQGDVIEKVSRRGKVFYSCSTYPKCDHAQWDRPIPTPCPSCKSPFINQRTGKGRRRQTGFVCPACQHEMQEAPP